MMKKILVLLAAILFLHPNQAFAQTNGSGITVSGIDQKCEGPARVEVTLNIQVTEDLKNKLGNSSFIKVTYKQPLSDSQQVIGRLDSNNSTTVKTKLRSNTAASFKIEARKDIRVSIIDLRTWFSSKDQTIASLDINRTIIDCKDQKGSSEGAPAKPATPAQPPAVPAGPNRCWPWDIDCICKGNPQGADILVRRCPTSTSNEFISALGGLCSTQCGEDQKTSCMDQVGSVCEKSKNFKDCIEKETKKLCPSSAAPDQPPVRRQTEAQSSDFEIITSDVCQDLTGEALTECKNPSGCKLEYTGFIREHDLDSFRTCVLDHKKAIIDKSKTPFGQLKARLKFDTWKLDVEVGAWCGVYQQDCESYATDTCSQQLLTANTPQNLIVSKFNKCIRDKYELGWDKITATPGTGATGARGPAGAAEITARRPAGQVVPDGYDAEKLDKHIYAWCGDGNGVTVDKKDACAEKALNTCKTETDEQKFIKCVQKVAKEGFGGQTLAEDALPPKPPFTPPAKKTPDALALINGSTEDTTVPSGTKSVQVGGKVKDGETCLDTAISLTFFKIEENGKKIEPPKLISLKPHDAAFLSGLPRNCTTYTASLDEKSGKYQLSVQLTDNLASKTATYNSSEIVINTLTVTQAPAVPTTAEVFSCQTKADPTGPNLIEARVEGGHPSYDKINWYIGKESIAFKDTRRLGKRTFDVEPNNTYQIQAEYYSQDVPAAERKEAWKCVPAVGVKTPASRQGRVKSAPKQLAAVLGAHTSPISFDILPIVKPESIVAVNVRAVTLDLAGDESEVLFPQDGDGSWENGRPLFLTIFNPSQVSAVKVTVGLVDETGQFLPSTDTSTIPISKPAEELTSLVEAAPQNIDLRMDPDQNQVTFTAYTVHPVDNPKFIVNDAEQDPAGSTCDQSGNSCVYSWTAYAPFSGSYPVSFGDKTETFNPPTEQAPLPEPILPAGGPKQVTKITLSRDDGSEEQVVYTRGETDDCCYAEASFDVNLGGNGLKYTVEYSDGTTETPLFLVERLPSAEGQPPAPTEEQPQQPPVEKAPQIPPPRTGGEPCENVGEYDRVCIDTDGTYKFRQCQENNIWSDWLGSETNPDNACRSE